MEILNSKEAAELMRVSVPAIRGMAASGEIPATQFGDDWRFLRSLLIDYVATRSIAEQLRRQELFKSKQGQAIAETSTENPKPGRRKANKIDLSGYAQS